MLRRYLYAITYLNTLWKLAVASSRIAWNRVLSQAKYSKSLSLGLTFKSNLIKIFVILNFVIYITELLRDIVLAGQSHVSWSYNTVDAWSIVSKWFGNVWSFAMTSIASVICSSKFSENGWCNWVIGRTSNCQNIWTSHQLSALLFDSFHWLLAIPSPTC